jgi:hypothetical protein
MIAADKNQKGFIVMDQVGVPSAPTTSGTRISSIRFDTPSFRLIGSETSGGTEGL